MSARLRAQLLMTFSCLHSFKCSNHLEHEENMQRHGGSRSGICHTDTCANYHITCANYHIRKSERLLVDAIGVAHGLVVILPNDGEACALGEGLDGCSLI